ncbi:NUDIX domain-containing protein [Vibrio aquaticus]|uniref:NUDIX domain-containing protein n=1 Tax=Vibrio aquaticus TaxID=2496559 RepID=A0A432CSM5_9VIBR|nr:NUDIX domain-containing protein [Vibrio aquaticus]RTZ14123.1 NUDIX domain-containing protein [Vibrio aquaticus]
MEHRIRSAGILIKDGAMLLLRVKDFSGEYWIPPGGGLEECDRSTKACVAREFKEEAGLQVEVGELLCVREFLETQTNRYHAEFFYLIEHFLGTPHLDNLKGLNDESYIQQVEWVPIPELAEKRLYPEELKNKLIDLIESQRFSTHLGSYIQGEREDINHL